MPPPSTETTALDHQPVSQVSSRCRAVAREPLQGTVGRAEPGLRNHLKVVGALGLELHAKVGRRPLRAAPIQPNRPNPGFVQTSDKCTFLRELWRSVAETAPKASQRPLSRGAFSSLRCGRCASSRSRGQRSNPTSRARARSTDPTSAFYGQGTVSTRIQYFDHAGVVVDAGARESIGSHSAGAMLILTTGSACQRYRVLASVSSH